MSRDSTRAASEESAALVARMAEGDDAALAALYDAYGHVAYALAFAIIGAQSAAEVVVSQAFAEAWRSAQSFNVSQTSAFAWLTTIVRRIALRVGRVAAVTSGVDKQDVATATPQDRSTAGYAVAVALRSLTAPQRRALELSYYCGFTVGQIAAQLGEPESGARELLRSAMQHVRSALAASRRSVFDEHVVTRA